MVKYMKETIEYVKAVARAMEEVYPRYLDDNDIKQIAEFTYYQLAYNHFVKDKVSFIQGYIACYLDFIKR